jgi:hypothetical protein
MAVKYEKNLKIHPNLAPKIHEWLYSLEPLAILSGAFGYTLWGLWLYSLRIRSPAFSGFSRSKTPTVRNGVE